MTFPTYKVKTNIFILSFFAFIIKDVPNCINKASLPPNLYFQTIKSDGSRHTMSSVIYIIQTGDQKFAPGDYISPVSCQEVT